MFQILEIAEIKVEQKTNYCLNFSLFFPIICILINISVVVIIVQFGQEIFSLSPVAYITIDFKKLVSDLFHAGSDVV